MRTWKCLCFYFRFHGLVVVPRLWLTNRLNRQACVFMPSSGRWDKTTMGRKYLVQQQNPFSSQLLPYWHFGTFLHVLPGRAWQKPPQQRLHSWRKWFFVTLVMLRHKHWWQQKHLSPQNQNQPARVLFWIMMVLVQHLTLTLTLATQFSKGQNSISTLRDSGRGAETDQRELHLAETIPFTLCHEALFFTPGSYQRGTPWSLVFQWY